MWRWRVLLWLDSAFDGDGLDVGVERGPPAFPRSKVREHHLASFFVPLGAVGEKKVLTLGPRLENGSFLEALDDEPEA